MRRGLEIAQNHPPSAAWVIFGLFATEITMRLALALV